MCLKHTGVFINNNCVRVWYFGKTQLSQLCYVTDIAAINTILKQLTIVNSTNTFVYKVVIIAI